MSIKEQPQGRLFGLDFVRVSALLGVVLYHSAAAYSTNTPYWSVHDGSSALATGIRELVDVFIMPIFFFLAGYFTLSSLGKRGNLSFLKAKFWELGYIWLFAVILILPIVWWATDVKSSGSSTGFVSYWLMWMGGVGQTSLGIATKPMVHMHFWFISLLFYFFVVFILLHAAKNKLFPTVRVRQEHQSPSNNNVLRILLLFGLATTVGYYLSLLVIPDTSWLSVKLFLQLQPAKLLLYIAYFGLGIYGGSRNWLARGDPIGRLSIWAPLTVVLGIVFMIAGQDVFLNPATTTSLSPAYLLVFALVRSFFLLAVLIVLVSVGMRYVNRPVRLVRELSDNSYHIYLIHIFIVSILQDILMIWPNGPVAVKIALIFFVATAMSYALSRWVFRKLIIRERIGRTLSRLDRKHPVQISS